MEQVVTAVHVAGDYSFSSFKIIIINCSWDIKIVEQKEQYRLWTRFFFNNNNKKSVKKPYVQWWVQNLPVAAGSCAENVEHTDCCISRVTAFGGGSMMKWAGISLTWKTRLVITESNLNGERHQDEILQSLSADLTWIPLNTCGMSLGVLFMPVWPTQPHWLTCDTSWLMNVMPSHSSVWPNWRPAWWRGARVL